MFLTNGLIGVSLARTLARILFVPRFRPPPPPPAQKPRRRCEPEEGYLRCSKRFDHRSHSIIFFLFEFKSVDDVGAGKLREMPTAWYLSLFRDWLSRFGNSFVLFDVSIENSCSPMGDSHLPMGKIASVTAPNIA